MIIHKLSAFLLVVGLVLNTTAFGAPNKTPHVKDGELSPELKQNALKLLSSIARDAGQFKLAENRVRARTIAADLMWEHDERAARVVYQNALVELRGLFGQINAARIEKMNDAEKSEHSANRFRLADLRRKFVLSLAARDSAAGIDALGSLKTKKLKEWEPLFERALLLKLETAAVVAAKDSDRAYALYAEEIAANGITLTLVESLDEFHQKNSELTAKIAKDIFAIIKSAKIGDLPAAKNRTNAAQTKTSANSFSAARSKQTELEFWQVTVFLNAASKLQRRAQRDKNSLAPLAAAEMRELAELLARAFLNAPNPAKNTINQAMTAITRYAPIEARRIRLKVGAEGVRSIETVMKSDAYYLSLEEKNADELAREADRETEPNHRDLLYAEAARKALEADEAEKAQIIAARIKDRDNHGLLIKEIEIAAPLAVARRGSPAEVRQMLIRLKTREERMAVMLELAATLAAKGDKETAKKLFNETVDMLFSARPDSKPDESGHDSGLELAGKFAAVSVVIAPDEAFTNIERIVESVNVEIKSNLSSDKNSVEAKELFYDSMERQLLLHAPNTIELLKNLARADFERTVILVDKFERPEIRLLARLRLVQALLDPEAIAKEKEMREQFLAEQYET